MVGATLAVALGHRQAVAPTMHTELMLNIHQGWPRVNRCYVTEAEALKQANCSS